MTDEELAEIQALLDDVERARERLHGLMGKPDRPRAPMVEAAINLFAEVKRLRDENATLHKVIEEHEM